MQNNTADTNTNAVARPAFILTHIRPDADAYGSAIGLALRCGAKAWFSEGDWNNRPNTILALCDKYADLVETHTQIGGTIPAGAAVAVTDCGDEGRVSLPAGTALGLQVVASFDHHLNGSIGNGPQFGAKGAVSASWVVVDSMPHEWVASEYREYERLQDATMAFLWAGHIGDSARFSVGDIREAVHQAADIWPDAEDAVLINAAYGQITPGRAGLLGAFWSSLRMSAHGAATTVLSNKDFTGNNATRADYAGMPGLLLDVAGVTVAAAVCQDSKEPGIWRIAFRSRGSGLAQKLARLASGDGHPDAAGGVVPVEVTDAVRDPAFEARRWTQKLIWDNVD